MAALDGIAADLREATDADAVDGVRPSVVACPTTEDEVSEVLAAAAADRLTVTVRGAGSKLSWGMPPASCDLVLDLSELDEVIEHQPGDLIVSARAGTPLSRVQQVVAEHGQRLAIDELVPGTTVGGLIATNLSGPLRMAAGGVRDLVIGVTVARADGALARSGGKVVKNVAGYDMAKLIIGSFGTLAVVTQAYFRLHPIPAAQQWLTIEAPSAGEAADLLAKAVHSQGVPSAVEISAAPGQPATVAVLLAGTERGVEARIGRIRELLGPSCQPADLGAARLPEGGIRLKLTSKLSAVAEVTQAAVDLGFSVRGSAGAGILHAAADNIDLPHALARLREATAAAGGAAVVLDAPTDLKRTVDVWGPVGGLEIMRRVKDQFDPDHRLSPGRFVGGI
ncbi:FAD-binding oxidoreductase [Calidifontibacter sp. DB0510]|uniref:FAD-binding oxidoreductase n=1 Tax=Metallococcus carri TaxID=1656884 RepID=A0A967AWG8_9MICO|nr:FAD-binding oxidoreductase [Metallococcus carri]NHN54216.1 FAD-binding oxidoreductase [Metallococcus carri]NOP36944.1 FAD-binding oxidoreductase [Calidifontibacter sp. DB2511S]